MVGQSGSKEPAGSLDPGQWASLALTHVQCERFGDMNCDTLLIFISYTDHPDDPLSIPLALITLAPPFLLVSYVTLILVRRELTMLSGLIGQLGCEGLNLALKRIFKQGRPTDFLGTGYGMPSSHSQFMGYFMTFWCIHLYRFRPGRSRAQRAKKLGQKSRLSLIGVLRTAEHFSIVLFICTLSLATAYSR
jgi:dolichyldiphosphatase